MAGQNGSDNGDGGTKKPRTEAEKRRRTEQRKKRRTRKADLRREQGQMLRQLGEAAPMECRFCYATTHESAACPDKEVIQAREKRKVDRRLHMKQSREEAAATTAEAVHMSDAIRALFADRLQEGAPLTSVTLAELYQQLCLRKLSNALPPAEEINWNLTINNAVRLALVAGDNRSSAYLGRLTLEA